MEYIAKNGRLLQIIMKYKYVIIILLIGMVFLLLPSSKDKAAQKVVISEPVDNILSVEDQLSQILSSVKGAGRVQVMLSIANGEEILYQTNESHSSDSERTSAEADTVTITDANRNQTGLIRQVNPPIYSGAIIVCQGGDNPSVRLSLIDAVSKITGLRTDKISVLKMK